jgi:hypothetical protein
MGREALIFRAGASIRPEDGVRRVGVGGGSAQEFLESLRNLSDGTLGVLGANNIGKPACGGLRHQPDRDTAFDATDHRICKLRCAVDIPRWRVHDVVKQQHRCIQFRGVSGELGA